MNGRNCNAQYGGIVPPSKWKSQSLIGKVIASLQRPLEAPVPIETWGWTSRCVCTVISALELRMRIGWSSLKNKLFEHYLSKRNNIHGAVHFRFCCWFEIYNLIATSASSFWDFKRDLWDFVWAARRCCKYGGRVNGLSLKGTLDQCLSGLTALVNVKIIQMANQIKVGGVYCSQTSDGKFGSFQRFGSYGSQMALHLVSLGAFYVSPI